MIGSDDFDLLKCLLCGTKLPFTGVAEQGAQARSAKLWKAVLSQD